MSKKTIEGFLRDFSYNSKFTILEEGKDDSEMKAIAEKRGIILPAKDLSVFKCIYAYIDRVNLNGCSLPQAEVEKSLQTLVGKAIDFDHIRGRIVGTWIDAKVEDNKIIAYGIFYKGNLQDDYDIISDLLRKNQLMISFEAYGTREFIDNESYDLNDIEWAGGALLIDTNPAFPGAAVLEMSNKRVLEFAKVMTPPEQFIKSRKEKYLEKSSFTTMDFEAIMRVMSEVKCPGCECQYCLNVDEIDFKGNEAEATCYLCGTECEVKLTPLTMITKSGRDIESVKKMLKDMEVKTVDSNKNEKGENKMTEPKKEETSSEELIIKSDEDSTIDPIADLKADLASEEAEVVVEKKEEAVEKVEDVVKEEKPSVEASTDTDEVKKLKEEIELLKAQIQKKDEEILVKVEEAKKTTATLIERRSVLGEFAKDMKEEDILNDDKFEISRLKKENTDLKKNKLEKSSLEVGGEEKPEAEVKEEGKKEDKELSLQKRIHDKTWK